MALYLTPGDEIKDCSSALVFLRGENRQRIEILGGIVSAESDTDRLIIKSKTTTAVFDIEEVANVQFFK